jgi:hypothetical protein
MRFFKMHSILILATGLAIQQSTWAQQSPFTYEQVQSMVSAGLANESGAKLIKQCGIDFAFREDFLQSLKAAGANEAFLNALRAANRAETSDQSNQDVPR